MVFWMKLKVGRRGGRGLGLLSVTATGSLRAGLLILARSHNKKLGTVSAPCVGRGLFELLHLAKSAFLLWGYIQNLSKKARSLGITGE